MTHTQRKLANKNYHPLPRPGSRLYKEQEAAKSIAKAAKNTKQS